METQNYIDSIDKNQDGEIDSQELLSEIQGLDEDGIDNLISLLADFQDKNPELKANLENAFNNLGNQVMNGEIELSDKDKIKLIKLNIYGSVDNIATDKSSENNIDNLTNNLVEKIKKSETINSVSKDFIDTYVESLKSTVDGLDEIYLQNLENNKLLEQLKSITDSAKEEYFSLPENRDKVESDYKVSEETYDKINKFFEDNPEIYFPETEAISTDSETESTSIDTEEKNQTHEGEKIIENEFYREDGRMFDALSGYGTPEEGIKHRQELVKELEFIDLSELINVKESTHFKTSINGEDYLVQVLQDLSGTMPAIQLISVNEHRGIGIDKFHKDDNKFNLTRNRGNTEDIEDYLISKGIIEDFLKE